jgi:hypothetical protein
MMSSIGACTLNERNAAPNVLVRRVLIRLELPFFIILWLGTVLAAVFDALEHRSEKRRVPVQPPLLVLRVERRVHPQVALIH